MTILSGFRKMGGQLSFLQIPVARPDGVSSIKTSTVFNQIGVIVILITHKNSFDIKNCYRAVNSPTDYWSNEQVYVVSVSLRRSMAARIGPPNSHSTNESVDKVLTFFVNCSIFLVHPHTRVGDDDSYKTVLGLPPQGPESAYLTIITLVNSICA